MREEAFVCGCGYGWWWWCVVCGGVGTRVSVSTCKTLLCVPPKKRPLVSNIGDVSNTHTEKFSMHTHIAAHTKQHDTAHPTTHLTKPTHISTHTHRFPSTHTHITIWLRAVGCWYLTRVRKEVRLRDDFFAQFLSAERHTPMGIYLAQHLAADQHHSPQRRRWIASLSTVLSSWCVVSESANPWCAQHGG